ncbi:MAG: hypothetical protein LJU34_07830, partial [Oscillospiraceae bacterium]|nr:hypothetical protein [Oscillospiraceae bacterium]
RIHPCGDIDGNGSATLYLSHSMPPANQTMSIWVRTLLHPYFMLKIKPRQDIYESETEFAER